VRWPFWSWFDRRPDPLLSAQEYTKVLTSGIEQRIAAQLNAEMTGFYDGLLGARCRACGGETDRGDPRTCLTCGLAISIEDIVNEVRDWLQQGFPRKT
jgi:hypothetical protein